MGTVTHVILDGWTIKFYLSPVVGYVSVLLNDRGLKICIASGLG